MLSIEQAYELQEYQQPSADVSRALGEITLVAFVGPSAAGKNFLMEATGLPQVGTVTSRAPRETDNKSLYTYSNNDHMLRDIEDGNFVQYGVALPDRIYASRLTDYDPDKPNVADIYFDAVEPLRHIGFKKVKTVNVLTPDAAQFHSQLVLKLEGERILSAHERLSKDQAALRAICASIWAGSSNTLTVLNKTDNVEENVDRINLFAYDKLSAWPKNDELLLSIESMRKVIETVQSRLIGS